MSESEYIPDVIIDDPKRPWKAIVPAGLTIITAFVGFWVADEDPFTAKEMASAAISALVSSGIIGTATYFTKNPKMRE